MDPQKSPLSELFDGKVSYLVPNYQRLYVWSREDQWEPLWLDVQNLADALVKNSSDRSPPSGIDESAVEPHFMGAVVLKISGKTPKLARQWRVIDGQQRLTTLQLLLLAAERAIRNLDENYADRLLDLITNARRGYEDGGSTYDLDQFKINFQHHRRGHHYESFGPILRAALGGSDTADVGGPIAECYRYFREAIRGWLDPHQYPELAAAALGETLLSKLFVIALYLDDREKEHIIFETLNARGEPLTEWDKAKNYLLFKAGESHGLDPAIVFEDYLDRFDDQWWRQEVGRGTQARPRTDVFLDYWLESKIRKPVSARRVFREFQAYFENRQGLTAAVLEELIRDAEYFRRSENPGGRPISREASYHFRRRAMGLGVIWPVLLHLHRIVPSQLGRQWCLDTLESYFARRLIVGRQARNYTTVVMDLLQALPDKMGPGDAANKILTETLLSYSWDGALWPSDGELRGAVAHRWADRARRLALAAIECRLIPDTAGHQADFANLYRLHIEHIMPIGWTEEDWPLPDSDDPEDARRSRDSMIETIGNLTLLHERLNQEISNSSWAIKREKIEKGDNLSLTSQLLEDARDDWTEDKIRARGEWMYDQLKDIWPRVHRGVRVRGDQVPGRAL